MLYQINTANDSLEGPPKSLWAYSPTQGRKTALTYELWHTDTLVLHAQRVWITQTPSPDRKGKVLSGARGLSTCAVAVVCWACPELSSLGLALQNATVCVAQTTDVYFLTVSEVASPRSRRPQVGCLLRPLSLTYRGRVLPGPTRGFSSVRTHPWHLFF